jgi:hypothetical protein
MRYCPTIDFTTTPRTTVAFQTSLRGDNEKQGQLRCDFSSHKQILVRSNVPRILVLGVLPIVILVVSYRNLTDLEYLTTTTVDTSHQAKPAYSPVRPAPAGHKASWPFWFSLLTARFRGPRTACPSIDPRRRPQRARVLLGIFSTKDDIDSRNQYRAMFQFWKSRDCRYHHAICSFSEYQQELKRRKVSQCELIYSFVIGVGQAFNGTEAPTEITNDERPLLVNRSAMKDWEEFDDTTLLNIRENTNDGKAQTWLRYASRVAEDHDFEYVAKCEQTAYLDIRKYFRFADLRLLPQPYDWDLLAGALRDRSFWTVHPPTRGGADVEEYMARNFEGHLYIESKCTSRLATAER